MKWHIRVVWTVAALTLTGAGVSYFATRDSGPQEASQQPPLEVGETTFEVLADSPGRREFVIPIHNPASVPRRIIGVGEG